MVVPDYLKTEYPFKSNYLDLRGIKLHYLDEGSGEPMVMVHGNPTWSFYYRNLVKKFSKTHRVIVPDHIGCGLSDKPQDLQDYNYTLERRISDLVDLISKLELKNITLVVHDWGGAIGFGYATLFPENVRKVIILNTAAFLISEIPFRISICKFPIIGSWLIRKFNAFARPAISMAVSKKMSDVVKKGYLLPYDNYENRIAISRFVEDIPMISNHPSYKILDTIGKTLHKVTCPKLILWGGKDFCFNKNFLNRWKEFYPEIENHIFENAGHYVLEDAGDEVGNKIEDFIARN